MGPWRDWRVWLASCTLLVLLLASDPVFNLFYFQPEGWIAFFVYLALFAVGVTPWAYWFAKANPTRNGTGLGALFGLASAGFSVVWEVVRLVPYGGGLGGWNISSTAILYALVLLVAAGFGAWGGWLARPPEADVFAKWRLEQS